MDKCSFSVKDYDQVVVYAAMGLRGGGLHLEKGIITKHRNIIVGHHIFLSAKKGGGKPMVGRIV